jgi:8-oxo-dGTP diphosphatase
MMDVVCAVIHDEERRVLACLRPEGKHLGGLWEFPGGKVEHGESPEEALAREIMEELGVVLEVGASLREVIWAYGDRTIRLIPFHGRIVSGELVAHEHERLLWCVPEEMNSLKWAGADVAILKELFSNFGNL